MFEFGFSCFYWFSDCYAWIFSCQHNQGLCLASAATWVCPICNVFGCGTVDSARISAELSDHRAPNCFSEPFAQLSRTSTLYVTYRRPKHGAETKGTHGSPHLLTSQVVMTSIDVWECHHVSSIAVLSLREFLHCNVTARVMALKRAIKPVLSLGCHCTSDGPEKGR
jgi:hypothetical protein